MRFETRTRMNPYEVVSQLGARRMGRVLILPGASARGHAPRRVQGTVLTGPLRRDDWMSGSSYALSLFMKRPE
jgi:hypothetical protein